MTLTIKIPDLLSTLLSQDEPREERGLLVEAVCGLYARHRVSSGEAAFVFCLNAGMIRWGRVLSESPMLFLWEVMTAAAECFAVRRLRPVTCNCLPAADCSTTHGV
jgi:hypothetical protein